MKRFLLLLLLTLSLTPFVSRATHVTGEELSYKNIGPGVYKITLVLYGTCRGQNYSDLSGGTPYIAIVDSTVGPSGSVYSMLALTQEGDSVDVTPFCPSVVNNCNNPTSTWQGVMRYVYSGTITNLPKSSKWAFVFTSALGNNCSTTTGRNNASNIINPNNDNISLYATLNNSVSENSSPVYIDTPKYNVFFCSYLPYIYSQASTDADNDSLSYAFAQPYYYNSNGNCTSPAPLLFRSPYNVNNPLPSTFSLNSHTGEIDFKPSVTTDSSLVSIRISEYRNGVLVGTSMREKIFIVDNKYCAIPPIGHIDTVVGLSGANVFGLDTLYTCPGGTVSFQVPIKDTVGDSTIVSFNDILGGSTVTVDSNNTTHPKINFSWSTAGLAYGVYTLTANFNTRSCPLPVTTFHTYTIIIGDAGLLTYNVLSATDCIRKAAMQYNVNNGGRAYTLKLLQGTDTLKTYNEPANTLVVQDSLAAGTYFVILQTAGLPCTSYIPMDIFDSGPFPYKPLRGDSLAVYCRNFKDSTLAAYLDSGANYLKWYDGNNNPIPGPVLPSTATAGTFVYTVSQVYKTCESARDTLTVIVNPDVCDYDVNIHNVITPNGDGKNDLWEIENLKFYPDVKVEVFDKLGDKIYEQSHYGSPWWDGGKVPSGVYYYVVDLGKPNIATGQQKYTGILMIKR